MIRRILLISVILNLTGECLLANDEKASIFYMYEPAADFEEDLPGDVSMQKLDVSTGYPLYQSKQLMIIPGLSLGWSHFSFSEVKPDTLDTYSLSIPITLITPFDENTRFISVIAPGLYSDLEATGRDDFQLFGMVLGAYRMSEQFSWSAGLIYNQDFGDAEVYPAAGFNWNISPSWELNMNMPRPRLIYTPTDQLSLSLHAEPSGDSWRIDLDGEDAEVELETFRLGLGMGYQATSHLLLVLDTGISLNRSYTLKTDDSTVMDSDVENTYFVRMGVIYR